MNDAPYVMSDRRKLPPEDFAIYNQKFRRSVEADQKHRNRGIRNIMAGLNLDDSQVSENLKAALREEGREPQTYNFIQMICRGHVGNYLMNAVDPKFIDREGDDIRAENATKMATQLWHACSNRHNFDGVARHTFENGLYYRGDCELVVDRPSSNPRTWSIKFEPVRFDLLIYDQSNLSDKISRNSQEAHKVFYLSAQQMIDTWPDAEPQVLGALAAMAKGDKTSVAVSDEMDLGMFISLFGRTKLGNKHQVVEYYHIENERVSKHWWVNALSGRFEPLPETGFRFNSPEDVAAKTSWIYQTYGQILNWDAVVKLQDNQPVLYTTVFVPNLGLVLDNARDIRQLDGHLPFYSWAFMQKFGMSIGLVDVLIHMQDDVNKREMALTKVLTQSPIHGKAWISQDVALDSDRQLEEIIDEYSDISKPLVTPAGIPGNTLAGMIQGTQINPALFGDIAAKTDMIEKAGSVPPVMQGRSSNSAESGIAVGRRLIEAGVMNRQPLQAFVENERDKAVDWLIMQPKVLGGAHNVSRRISGGDRSIVVNSFEGYDEEGREVIKNDVRELKRMDVIVTEAKNNDYMKQAQREMDVAALQSFQPTPENEPIRAVFECSLAQNMDFADEQQRELTEDACRKRMQIANLRAEMMIKGLSAQVQGPPMPPPPPNGQGGGQAKQVAPGEANQQTLAPQQAATQAMP